MFVNIIQFPPVTAGKDDQFRDWFAWSNELYTKHEGFISRRLLKPLDSGNYVGIVEHDSYETFMAMHTGSTQAEARKRVKPLLESDPTPQFFDLIVS